MVGQHAMGPKGRKLAAVIILLQVQYSKGGESTLCPHAHTCVAAAVTQNSGAMTTYMVILGDLLPKVRPALPLALPASPLPHT